VSIRGKRVEGVVLRETLLELQNTERGRKERKKRKKEFT